MTAGWSLVERAVPPALGSRRPAGHPPAHDKQEVPLSAAAVQPVRDPWCDTEGAPFGLFGWVEQVVEDTEPTVLPSKLHQHGQVIGRGLDSLYVRFSDNHVISLRPELLRVLDAAPGGD
jgi:hypothetical protein